MKIYLSQMVSKKMVSINNDVEVTNNYPASFNRICTVSEKGAA